MKELMKKLSEVQNEMKVPKNQRNNFAKFNYRSAEDILEEAKPICHKHGLTLTISDGIEMVGDRYFVKAIATVYDQESGCDFAVTGYAREASVEKGKAEAQITGATSSYARKYALNGLFLLDDNKDADTNEYQRQQQQQPPQLQQNNRNNQNLQSQRSQPQQRQNARSNKPSGNHSFKEETKQMFAFTKKVAEQTGYDPKFIYQQILKAMSKKTNAKQTKLTPQNIKLYGQFLKHWQKKMLQPNTTKEPVKSDQKGTESAAEQEELFEKGTIKPKDVTTNE